MMSIFNLRDIFFKYEAEWVLNDISIEVHKGSILGVIGPNGSGKTTLLKLLSGNHLPQKGRLSIKGMDMAGIKQKDLARIIAVVPQESFFSFPYTVLETVMMGRVPHLEGRLFENQRDYDVVRQTMQWTDITELSGRPVTDISGGERQRAIIARALAQEPDVLILDEPASSLDIAHQMDVFNILTRLNEEKGITVIISSHDLNAASQYCHRVVLMDKGRIHSEGSPLQVITEENIREVYGCPVMVDLHPMTKRPRVTLSPSERRIHAGM